MLAAESGDVEKITSLLSSSSSSSSMSLSGLPSSFASLYQPNSAASYKVVRGSAAVVGSTSSSSDSSTPLHHASSRNRFQAAAALLLAGAPVDARNRSSETPLHLACYNGHMTLAELLIDHGANINALNTYQDTPLHYASRKGNVAAVRMLLQRQADCNIENSLGDKPFDEAADGHTEKAFEQYKSDGANGLTSSDCGVDSCKDGSSSIASFHKVTSKSLLHIFAYLTAPDLCRAATVCTRWHRSIEEPELWKNLGVRRWELALASSMNMISSSSANRGSNPSSRPSSVGGSDVTKLECSESNAIADAFSMPPMAMFRPAIGGPGRAGKAKNKKGWSQRQTKNK